MEGTKHDQNKVRFSMLPWGALRELAWLTMFGAEKYEKDNYLKIAPERYIDAAFRHLSEYVEDPYSRDDETNSSHLISAAWCLLAALAIHLRGPHGYQFRFDVTSIGRMKERKQSGRERA